MYLFANQNRSKSAKSRVFYHLHMTDSISKRFGSSIDEAAVWCAARSLGSDRIDVSAMQHRSSLLRRMAQLWQEARTHLGDNWHYRSMAQTPQHHEAMALSQAVRESLGPLDNILRSESLRPDFGAQCYDSAYPWTAAVAHVVANRAALLRQNSSKNSTADVAHGRLLLYDPDENLADGAAEYSSSGFFDSNNVPPWDIWVGMANRTLVSWVPPVLVEAAQMGIDANPESCIRWAT